MEYIRYPMRMSIHDSNKGEIPTPLVPSPSNSLNGVRYVVQLSPWFYVLIPPTGVSGRESELRRDGELHSGVRDGQRAEGEKVTTLPLPGPSSTLPYVRHPCVSSL